MSSTSSPPSKVYLKRKVAAPKPCSICFKPTATCMYNPNIYQGIGDWFYCCDIHLEDNPSFMAPLYDASYDRLLEETKTAEARLQNAQEELKSCGSWDTWLNGFLSKKKTAPINESETKSKTNDNAHEDEGSAEQGEDEETSKSKKEKSKDTTKTSTKELLKNKIKELAEQKKSLTSKLVLIKQNNKKFEINDVMYRSKIMTIQQRMRKQKELKAQEEAYTHTDPTDLLSKFPALPKNKEL